MEPPKLQQNQVNNYGYAQANLLVNPGFEIWQRGAGPFTGNYVFTADEWMVGRSGGAHSVSRVASTAGAGFGNYALQLTASSSPTWVNIRQGIESWKELEGRDVTLSVLVKSDSSDARAQIYDYDGSTWESESDNHSGNNEWEWLTVTKTIRTGLTGDANIPHSFAIQLNAVRVDENAVIEIAAASLVIGNFPQGVPFLSLNPAEDMQRCERFLQVFGEIRHRVYGFGTNNISYTVPLRCRMQATPTISIGSWTTQNTTAQTVGTIDTGTLIHEMDPASSGNTKAVANNVDIEVT